MEIEIINICFSFKRFLIRGFCSCFLNDRNFFKFINGLTEIDYHNASSHSLETLPMTASQLMVHLLKPHYTNHSILLEEKAFNAHKIQLPPVTLLSSGKTCWHRQYCAQDTLKHLNFSFGSLCQRSRRSKYISY